MAPDRRFGPRLKTYKIAAVFETGVSSYDDAFVFMPVRKAQDIFKAVARFLMAARPERF